jgi:hypothetical protein
MTNFCSFQSHLSVYKWSITFDGWRGWSFWVDTTFLTQFSVAIECYVLSLSLTEKTDVCGCHFRYFSSLSSRHHNNDSHFLLVINQEQNHNFSASEWELYTSALLVTCFIRSSCLAYSSTLKTETHSFKSLCNIQWTTQRYIPATRTSLNNPC